MEDAFCSGYFQFESSRKEIAVPFHFIGTDPYQRANRFLWFLAIACVNAVSESESG
jgi:hypothetical protein